ncbi:MAG: hypothetical protein MJE68_00930 [Proteobacteria bacterium]|nr:hypothetical protein [Pseudomonadota bacterium]
MILVILLIASVVINVILILAQRAYRRSNKANDPSPDCALAMDSNPCYEASNVKQVEVQEAVHVYDTVKQHS